MAQDKLQRFKEIKSFPNVLEYPENMPDKWNTFFKNDNALTLELACGKGEYTVALAEIYQDKNFIGVDIKGNRIWVGAKKCLDKNLSNAAFLRIQIDKIDNYFSADEADEIWITFPDPQLRISKAKKRLTHPKFLRLYKKFLKPGGLIHLKTDSPDLYEFTKLVARLYDLTIISDINDVYNNKNISTELAIKTHYEKLDIAKSRTVFYVCFTLPGKLKENDIALHDLLKNKTAIEI